MLAVKLVILIGMLTFRTGLSLKSSELCFSQQHDCKAQLKMKTGNLSACYVNHCHGQYSYQCSLEYCSTDTHACQMFLKLKHEIRSLNSLRSRMGIEKMFEKKLEKNNKFIMNIKICQKYEWKPSDLCMRGKNCRMLQKIPMIGRLGGFEYLKTIQCPCLGSYSYNCGNQYCSKDKTSCSTFLNKNNTYLLHGSFKKCITNPVISQSL